MRILLASLLLSGLAACSTPQPPPPLTPAVPGPDLLLHVYEAGAQPEIAVSGATVSAFTDDGREVPIGRTFGDSIRIHKSDLRGQQAKLLLVCHPAFRCVALRLSEEKLYDFDEFYVDLPKVVVR